MASPRTTGNFYLLSKVLIIVKLSKTKVAVNISDLSVKANVTVNNIEKTLDEKISEMSWQLYNLIQEKVIIIEY